MQSKLVTTWVTVAALGAALAAFITNLGVIRSSIADVYGYFWPSPLLRVRRCDGVSRSSSKALRRLPRGCPPLAGRLHPLLLA